MKTWLVAFLLLISFNAFSCELEVRLDSSTLESKNNISTEWLDIDIELTQALMSEVNCKFNIVTTPWARALLMLSSGEIDLLTNVSKTQEREKLYYFVGPVQNEEIVFATYKELNYNIIHVEDIFKLDKPIAIQRNAFYGKAMQQVIDDEKYQDLFIIVANNETKLRLLKRGRISGFLEAKRFIVNGIQQNASYTGLWFPDVVIHQSPIYFALSKKSISETLYLKLSTAFEHLTSQGKVKEIIIKHSQHYSPVIPQDK